MTINEWKNEFEKLYHKMKEDIGTEHMEVSIIEERTHISHNISTSEIKIHFNL